jgi:predicted alpha/beta superfamily hydrolase
LACSSGNSPGEGGETPDAGDLTDGAVTRPTEGDADIFEDMLAGEVAPADGLRQIAWSGGWPLERGGKFVFVHLDDGGGPYRLAGDHNGWSPTTMNAADGFYWTEVVVPGPASSHYKFVNASDEYSADRWARRYGYDEFGEISRVRADDAHLERWPELRADGLATRDLRVWVPDGEISHHLYVHDGQNLFDPGAMHGGWQLTSTAPAGTLVVGIDNTADRMNEYTHVVDDIGEGDIGGSGDAYADLVELSIRPRIEAEYGTPTRVGVMGSSLGGLISLHIADRYPGSYDFVASLSGTLGWGSFANKSETLIERYQSAGKRDFVIYVDSGGNDGGGCFDGDADGINDDSGYTDNYCTNRQMADVLAGLGYTYDTDLYHWHELDAPHNEVAWAARVFRPLGIFAAL